MSNADSKRLDADANANNRRREAKKIRTLVIRLWVICGSIVYPQRTKRNSPRHLESIAGRRT
jgi:hypothetical protein